MCFVNHILCIHIHAPYFDYFAGKGLSQEEEDEVILESEKEAARRAFQALEREGSFPESSDSSSGARELQWDLMWNRFPWNGESVFAVPWICSLGEYFCCFPICYIICHIIFIDLCLHSFIYLHLYCMCLLMCMSMFVFLFILLCIYIYICVCACMCMYFNCFFWRDSFVIPRDMGNPLHFRKRVPLSQPFRFKVLTRHSWNGWTWNDM